MYDPNSFYEQRSLDANNAIHNAQTDETLHAGFATINCDAAKLQEGMGIRNAADEVHQRKQREQRKQVTATRERGEKWIVVQEGYMRHVKLSRILLKGDEPTLKKLDLLGDRADDISGWIGQCKNFYFNALANETILAKLATLNISRDALEQGKTLLGELGQAQSRMLIETGDAQSATEEQKARFKQLNDWMSPFLAYAKVIFEGCPQEQEKLGIIA